MSRYLIGNYIVLNIFLAILLDNFEKTTDSSDTLYAELEESNEVLNALEALKKTIADLFFIAHFFPFCVLSFDALKTSLFFHFFPCCFHFQSCFYSNLLL